MARRRLTDEERKLWRHVTRDVQKFSGEAPLPEPSIPAVSRALPGLPKVPGGKDRIKTRPLSLPLPTGAAASREAAARSAAPDHNWQQKLRRGKAGLEGKIDLHGMTQERAYQALCSYIDRAQSQGKRVILVVTGKGGPKRDLDGISHRDFDRRRGILRDQVPKWLATGELRRRIVSWYVAGRRHGGDGALYVVLKRRGG